MMDGYASGQSMGIVNPSLKRFVGSTPTPSTNNSLKINQKQKCTYPCAEMQILTGVSQTRTSVAGCCGIWGPNRDNSVFTTDQTTPAPLRSPVAQSQALALILPTSFPYLTASEPNQETCLALGELRSNSNQSA